MGIQDMLETCYPRAKAYHSPVYTCWSRIAKLLILLEPVSPLSSITYRHTFILKFFFKTCSKHLTHFGFRETLGLEIKGSLRHDTYPRNNPIWQCATRSYQSSFCSRFQRRSHSPQSRRFHSR